MHVCSGVGCVQLVVGLAAVLVAGGPAVAAKPGEDRQAMADRRAVAERLRHEAAAVAHGAAYDPVNLARLGVAQAQVGHEAGALTTFDTILPADHRKIPEFIAELVVLRVRAGDTEGALRL